MNRRATRAWRFFILASLLMIWGVGLPAAMTVTDGLAPWQVLQVDGDGAAAIDCRGTLPEGAEGAVELRVVDASVAEVIAWTGAGEAVGGEWNAAVDGLPAGGPYTVEIRLADGEASAAIEPVYAGDLWILAGQSNMEGVGNMTDVETPHDLVQVFAMNDVWRQAEEPIHRRAESVDPVHNPRGEEGAREAREANLDVSGAVKGAGLGLTFAKEMVERTGRPVGLVPCAHGGTSMDQWDPARRDDGGDSLYGAMLRRFDAVGGSVRGVLWYQGESDTGGDRAEAYQDKFEAFIAAVRDDLGDPELPFYYVQLGALAQTGESVGWNTVRHAQYLIEETVPGVAAVAAIDLPLDDWIHVGVDGLKVLGARLADVAHRRMEGEDAFPGTPRPQAMEAETAPQGRRFRVVFEGVVDGLRAPADGRVSGFRITTGSDHEAAHPIFRQEIDPDNPNAVLLWVQNFPETPAYVWYGRGLTPFCNLTDHGGRGVLAFGPLPLPAPED